MSVPSTPRTLPLVFVLTMALVGTLVLGGTALLAVLDVIYSQQVQANLEKEAQRQADYLAETFSRMLWSFDLQEAQAVAAVVARSHDILELELVTEKNQLVFRDTKVGLPLLALKRSLRYKQTDVGTLSVTISRQSLDTQRSEVSVVAIESFGGLLFLLAFLAPLFLNQTVLRPFNRLTRALLAERAGGPFPFLPKPSSRILEVRTLETALAALNQAVAQQVDQLETRVQERTAELEKAQALLVRTETLATLGQLAAGIAHELNTPLGAILSSVRLLQDDWSGTMIPLVGSGLTIPGQSDSTAFLREVAQRSMRLEDYPDSTSRRQLRKRWIAAGRDPDTPLCDLICTSGVSHLLDELASIPEGHPANLVVMLVGQCGRSLAIIESATDKGASVVSALRAQVQPGESRDQKPLELRREIDQSLSLMQGKLRGGVHVEVRAPREVWVLGDRNELSKVWLNLVLNAIQAMDGSGTMVIDIAADGDLATVSITDSGPGIPASVVPRIWEPFYTTKPTGMGLGLEITKRIVTANRGTIDVETEPGRTTFRVCLPLWTSAAP